MCVWGGGYYYFCVCGHKTDPRNKDTATETPEQQTKSEANQSLVMAEITAPSTSSSAAFSADTSSLDVPVIYM